MESAKNVVDFEATLTYNYNGPQEQKIILSESITSGEIEVTKTTIIFPLNTLVNLKIKAKISFLANGGDLVKELSVYLNPTGSQTSTSGWVMKSNHIDARNFVPSITFGDLLKPTLRKGNYRMFIIGKVVYINKITPNISQAKDLEFSKNKLVEITRQPYKAIVFKSNAPDWVKDDKYRITMSGIETEFSDYEDDEKFEVNLYALPYVKGWLNYYVNGGSVYDIDEEDAGVCLIRYTGLQGGINNAADNSGLLISSIYQNGYVPYIINRILADRFKWNFKADNFMVRDLVSRDTVYAYGMYHKVRNIIKKFIGDVPSFRQKQE